MKGKTTSSALVQALIDQVMMELALLSYALKEGWTQGDAQQVGEACSLIRRLIDALSQMAGIGEDHSLVVNTREACDHLSGVFSPGADQEDGLSPAERFELALGAMSRVVPGLDQEMGRRARQWRRRDQRGRRSGTRCPHASSSSRLVQAFVCSPRDLPSDVAEALLGEQGCGEDGDPQEQDDTTTFRGYFVELGGCEPCDALHEVTPRAAGVTRVGSAVTEVGEQADQHDRPPADQPAILCAETGDTE
jgi:hypothetical protein